MGHPGFNIKVRKVNNGYTIHRSVFQRGGGEEHDDHVATRDSVETYLHEMIRREVDALKEQEWA